MKKIISLFLALVMCLSVSVSALAAQPEADFNAGLTVETVGDTVIKVTVVDSTVLHNKKPTLTIPCGFESATVTLNGAEIPCEAVDGGIAFTVAQGGTYVITEGTVPADPEPDEDWWGWYEPDPTPTPSKPSTDVVENEDGSTTTTVTDKTTGTVTETTEFEDGTVQEIVTETDGTVTITETTPDGVSLELTEAPGRELGISVTLPEEVDRATVTVPTEGLTATTVAVDVATGKVVPMSVLTEDGLNVTLNGSADLTLVDNQKSFTDVAPGWTQAGIDFVTSRELFNGVDTAAGLFAPSGSMTRGMLMTVLARLDGRDTSTGATWDAVGMEWAKQAGISDGTNADAVITREQLATMLWRYAGSPDVSISSLSDMSAFPDAHGVSQWGQRAMAWAISHGIINGVDGELAPGMGASRAMVATMIMRYCQNVI